MTEKLFMSSLYGKFGTPMQDQTAATDLILKDDCWMRDAAIDCINRSHFKLIPNRKKTGPYLLRCWLSTPKPAEEDGQKGWESGDSLLLHRFFAPDDDGSLHDHPWPFRTRILSGGYVEFLPPIDWSEWVDDDPESWRSYPRRITEGPAYGARQLFHRAGAVVYHAATDLHAVGPLLPALGPTWTLVETGPRVRTWDFFPPGKPRVPARVFLGY